MIYLFANSPAVHNRDDAGFPLRDFHESGFGHVEMHSWWVAPAAVVGGLRPVRRAEIGGGHRRKGNVFITRT